MATWYRPNALVDANERPLAVVDVGFLSSIGDPAFDAAVCASTFDMYSVNANEIRELLTHELASRLGYRVDELCLYQAAYAIATSNAYDRAGQDDHFAWYVGQLQRADIACLLGALQRRPGCMGRTVGRTVCPAHL